MATFTTNYNLSKPSVSDSVDITVLNKNFDTIDTEIKKAADAIPPVATTLLAGIVKPDGTTVTVDEDGTIHGAQTYRLPAATATTLGGVKVGKNLTVNYDGTINAYAAFEMDDTPTPGSTNVSTSGGTYTAINNVNKNVESLQSQVTALVTGITWKDAVSTFDNLTSTYPSPEVGWTVMCSDSGQAYYWNGTAWLFIFTSLVPVASTDEIETVLEGLA